MHWVHWFRHKYYIINITFSGAGYELLCSLHIHFGIYPLPYFPSLFDFCMFADMKVDDRATFYCVSHLLLTNLQVNLNIIQQQDTLLVGCSIALIFSALRQTRAPFFFGGWRQLAFLPLLPLCWTPVLQAGCVTGGDYKLRCCCLGPTVGALLQKIHGLSLGSHPPSSSSLRSSLLSWLC